MLGLASSSFDPSSKGSGPEWRIRDRDLKKYPHFDPFIPADEAEVYVRNVGAVSRHSFFPFIQYIEQWRCFRKKGELPKWKKRKIRYAARLDSYIFSYYRHILLPRYEQELTRLGIASSILAYRRIPISGGSGNKCNIHFARDAFDKIQQLGRCCAVALDIKSYFESLDHERLKTLWIETLGVSKLPKDHLRVFDAITRYSWVEKEDLYTRLGHFGEKLGQTGKQINGYLTPYKRIPKCLCNGRVFRDKIAGSRTHKSIIKKNKLSFGIPQGAPLSDLLANLYLIKFDEVVSEWAAELGGFYFRYSDDILLIVPGSAQGAEQLMTKVSGLITKFGDHLKIKDSKSLLLEFEPYAGGLRYRCIKGTKRKNGLEYLGFRFDGKRIYLRDSTMSNLLRKVSRAAWREAKACVEQHPGNSVSELKGCFNYERLLKKFCRVEHFGDVSRDYRNWTFWTYGRRASREFGSRGKPILRQLRRYRRFILKKADKAIEDAFVQQRNR